MSLKDTLGKNVRHYRKRTGLSQEELAAALELSEKSIGLLERGEVWPEFENLESIAMKVGVSVEDFFVGMIHKPIKPTPEEAIGVLQEALGIPKPHRPPQLTDEEQELLTNFRRLDPKLRGAVLNTAAGGSQIREKAAKKKL